ncbi:Uncharacterized protein MSYG_3895 [Malassezia sympodialis ATCC 42132]|uniref:EVE domain-containing protein n=1 Tax=Malassezia sympodialis (strain ATCC 42132) TaxID=1230383 RepID=A0A1M8AAN8_MALS4|nr:Uncharacterized protein MSYG_3895 [Malassezia sympodialis ATCC 42132]
MCCFIIYVLLSDTWIQREGYPDHTAWDPKHPYYDAKSDPENPRWFMVDVEFVRRLPHMVPLALLQHLASSDVTESQRKDVHYLDDKHIESLRGMALLNRSRLSVQPVDAIAYEAICLLGERGGFEQWPGKWNSPSPSISDEGAQVVKSPREQKRRRK